MPRAPAPAPMEIHQAVGARCLAAPARRAARTLRTPRPQVRRPRIRSARPRSEFSPEPDLPRAAQNPLAVKELFLLDPGVVYLNHGSYGACPRPVFEAYQRWQRELERQPVEFLGRRVDGLLADARARLAA